MVLISYFRCFVFIAVTLLDTTNKQRLGWTTYIAPSVAVPDEPENNGVSCIHVYTFDLFSRSLLHVVN